MPQVKNERPLVYLDHSATTPVDPRVAETVRDTLLNQWGNPSSRYKVGNDAKLVLETARERVAALINADPANVFFTSGGTEADNTTIFGVMRHAKANGRGNHLITTQIEHSAILKSAEKLETEGIRVTYLPVLSSGAVDLDALKNVISDDTVLVSVMHVNNEVGTIQPIEEIASICEAKNAYFHTDAVQSYGKVPIDVKNSGIKLLSASSHKIYGPKGVGFLYIHPDVELDSLVYGGGQEKQVRTGTENMPGIAGFGHAALLCAEEFEKETEELRKLRDDFFLQIKEKVSGEVILNGSMENRLHSNLNLQFPGVEAESLLLALDLDNIAVSTGSACSSGSTSPSHVLLAMGLNEHQAHASIRLSLGRSNTAEGLEYAAERIAYHVNRLREMAW